MLWKMTEHNSPSTLITSWLSLILNVLSTDTAPTTLFIGESYEMDTTWSSFTSYSQFTVPPGRCTSSADIAVGHSPAALITTTLFLPCPKPLVFRDSCCFYTFKTTSGWSFLLPPKPNLVATHHVHSPSWTFCAVNGRFVSARWHYQRIQIWR